ncbi:MAG: hypothetical protein RBR35_16115 [Salinivirgaceae bacterium]|nr:hypothetical protein [Salinivirgaceae bacterium]
MPQPSVTAAKAAVLSPVEQNIICDCGDNMRNKSKIWVCIFLAIIVLGGCSTMPPRPEMLARGDYSYTKKWLLAIPSG